MSIEKTLQAMLAMLVLVFALLGWVLFEGVRASMNVNRNATMIQHNAEVLKSNAEILRSLAEQEERTAKAPKE